MKSIIIKRINRLLKTNYPQMKDTLNFITFVNEMNYNIPNTYIKYYDVKKNLHKKNINYGNIKTILSNNIHPIKLTNNFSQKINYFCPDNFFEDNETAGLIDITCNLDNSKEYTTAYNEYIQLILFLTNLRVCKSLEFKYGSITHYDINEKTIYMDYYFAKSIFIKLKKNISSKKYQLKRKNESIEENIKKQKLSDNETKLITIPRSYISASKTRNFALNDCFLDVCKVFKIMDINDDPEKIKLDGYQNFTQNNDIDIKNINTFNKYLLNKGIKFEEEIYGELQKIFGKDIVKVCESHESIFIEKFNDTVEFMKSGVPILYQAVLHNDENETFGCVDILVRSDWINKIIPNTLSNEKINISAPLIGHLNFHYIVVDIKSCKMQMNSNGITLRNNHHIKPYKIQLQVYNMALGKIQGYMPDSTYILGNGWFYNKTIRGKIYKRKNNKPFNKFGTIDYSNFDNKYIDLTNDAIGWYKSLLNSDTISINPPSLPNIWPNMCNPYNGKFDKVKKQVAKKYGEITDVWKCGVKNREIAASNGINSWRDIRCNAKTLGIKGKTARIIDLILDCNRDTSNQLIFPKHVVNSDFLDDTTDLYLDIELINESVSKQSNFPFIFMIGVGWEENNVWKYKSFTAEKISIDEEKRLLTEFVKIVNELNCDRIFHWGDIENSSLRKGFLKHNIINDINDKLFDFCKVMNSEPIIIKGALKFDLKTIAKTMYCHGMIDSIWECDINSGVQAMFLAWKHYIHEKNNNIINEIKKYNEIDCKVLWEIINHLRDFYK